MCETERDLRVGSSIANERGGDADEKASLEDLVAAVLIGGFCRGQARNSQAVMLADTVEKAQRVIRDKVRLHVLVGLRDLLDPALDLPQDETQHTR